MSILHSSLRTIQTWFPSLVETKFTLQRALRQTVRQPFDSDFTLLSRMRPSEDDVFVDVGCNRGQSVDAIRLYHPGAPIVAFEPNPLLVKKLSSLFAADRHLRLEAFGLGEAAGTFELHVPFYSNWMFDGLASLDRDSAAMWLNSNTIIGFDERRLQIRTVHCEVQTLDYFQLKPYFIKIDVQGLEAAVIKGAMETIERHRPIILVESDSYGPIEQLLAPFGYQAATMQGGRLERGLRLSKNVFFLTEQSFSTLVPFTTSQS